MVDYDGENKRVCYILKDHLGSWYAVTDETGHVVNHKGAEQRYSFDPWGRRRNATTWSYDDTPTEFLFDRGFTGHEHLDSFGLINMNGRAYDPVLARFLSPDPVVQNPYSSQSFNRYSYCWNNPLVYTDPTGYYTWMDINNIIDALWNDNTNFRYGGSWSADGSYESFGSDAAAFENVINNINHTDGGWKSAIPPPGYQADLQLRITGWKPLFGTTSLNGKATIFVPPVKIPEIESVTIWVPGNQQSQEANTPSPIPMPGNTTPTRNPMPGGAAGQGGTISLLDGVPSQDFSGFWGGAKYFWTGGNIDGYHYNMDGKATGLSPNIGMPPSFIGGPLRKGEQALKLGKYLFNPTAFHGIKKGVLSFADPKTFSHIVGTNPDLMIKGGKIWLTGTKTGGYYGKSYETGMTIADFLKLF